MRELQSQRGKGGRDYKEGIRAHASNTAKSITDYANSSAVFARLQDEVEGIKHSLLKERGIMEDAAFSGKGGDGGRRRGKKKNKGDQTGEGGKFKL